MADLARLDSYAWLVVALCTLVPITGMSVAIFRRLRRQQRSFDSQGDIAVVYAPEVLPVIDYIRATGQSIATTQLRYFVPNTPPAVRCVALAFSSPRKRAAFLSKMSADMRARAGGDAALRQAAPVITHEMRGYHMLVLLGALARPA